MKEMSEEEKTDSGATEGKESESARKGFVSQNPADVVWVNSSKTGRGATIALNGDLYVASIQALQKLVNGETKGARFVKIIR